MNTLDHILRKYNIRLQPDTEHRLNHQTMPVDLNINRNQLAELFAELGYKSGAEIGVEQGEYSEVLAKANPEAKLYLVDRWKAYRGYRDHVSQEKLDAFFETTRARVERFPAVLMRKASLDAARDFKDESLDWVFIDANHSFDWVMQDIIHWTPKVRAGGLVCGHDYFVGTQGQGHQVPIAVKAYTEAHKVWPWFVARGDHSPSWFFVRQ